jgi:methylenetetrahydrofolate--tRNA-(uracil-5-)-methyltransferase
MQKPIRIIGAGLAGSEAAWQCARRGVAAQLFEMRPVRSTPAHQTANFAELVCSNSLKSDTENTAPWLLKEEMRRAGSLLIEIARATTVPAGHALAVDREKFAEAVTAAIEREPLIEIVREEVTTIDENNAITIIATGPLTSDALSHEILRLSGSEQLYFYDSISPIVEADSIDMSRVYMAARYDKGSADYINCPMTREEYERFLDALIEAHSVDAKEWENLNYFESCLPIEEIARRGRDTLRFGPMKPVGLRDPRTGQRPYAGPHPAPYPRSGEREIPPLRSDSPQHLYQWPHFVARDFADAAASQRVIRGTDFWSRRLCGVHRHWLARWNAGSGVGSRCRAHPTSACDSFRRAGELHLPCRC